MIVGRAQPNADLLYIYYNNTQVADLILGLILLHELTHTWSTGSALRFDIL